MPKEPDKLTQAEYLAMIHDRNQRAKVTEMIRHGPYMDPGHPFRLAIAEWLKEMSQEEFEAICDSPRKFKIYYYDEELGVLEAANMTEAAKTVGRRYGGMAGISIREYGLTQDDQ